MSSKKFCDYCAKDITDEPSALRTSDLILEKAKIPMNYPLTRYWDADICWECTLFKYKEAIEEYGKPKEVEKTSEPNKSDRWFRW